MKNLIFIFILLLHCSDVFSTNIILKIFLNTDNCFACEGNIRTLQHLKSSIKIEIHTSKNNEGIIGEYLEKFGLDSSRYTIKYHKKISFDELKHKNSYFELCVNNKSVTIFYGNELEKYVTGLNAVSIKNLEDTKIALPETTIFSGVLTTFINSDIINLNDYKLGKNLTCSLNIEKTGCIITSKILAKDFKYDNFFQLAHMDTSFYHNYKDEALKRGTLASLEQSYLTDSSLYLVFTIPYYYFRIPNVLRSDSRLLLAKKNLNSPISFFYIKDDHVTSGDSTTYFIDNTKSFFIQEGSLVFPLFASNHKGDTCKLYMKTYFDHDTIKFHSFLNVTLNRIIVNKYKLDDEISLSNSEFNYYVNHKIIYNYKKNELISSFISDKSGGDIIDVKIYGNIARLLSIKNNMLTLITYDLVSKKILIKKKINFKEDVNILSARIFDPSYILAVNKKGNYFLLKALNL